MLTPQRKPWGLRSVPWVPPQPASPIAALRLSQLTGSEAMAGEALRLLLIEPNADPARLHRARECIGDTKQFADISRILTNQATFEDVGRSWTGYMDRKQAYAAGVAIVKSALVRLVRGWL